MSQGVTLADVRAAAEAVGPALVRTPCLHSRTLSEIAGAELFLKFENLQFTGSFKERGALARLLSLPAEARRRGVIAMSAGNHALGVAYHARRLGIPALIVMPRFASAVKVEHTRGFGAEVVLEGESFDEAARVAHALSGERGLELVHPYDDPRIIAGQGTVALEMLADQPGLECLVVPVGGGGLVAGIATAARAIRPDVSVVGVQSAQFPSMWQALRGEPARCGPFTIADGIAVKEPGRQTLPIVRDLVERILLVEEDAIEKAVLLLLEVEKTVVEGAGAASLAAVLGNPGLFAGRRVGLVLSGGNLDLAVLSTIIQRGLVRSRRLVRLRVAARDVPGALARITERIGAANANIVEVRHEREFTHVPVQVTEMEFVLQTRGPEHVAELLRTLEAAGFETELLDTAAEP